MLHTAGARGQSISSLTLPADQDDRRVTWGVAWFRGRSRAEIWHLSGAQRMQFDSGRRNVKFVIWVRLAWCTKRKHWLKLSIATSWIGDWLSQLAKMKTSFVELPIRFQNWPDTRIVFCIVVHPTFDLVSLFRAFSSKWPAATQIYCNKRKRWLKKRVQIPQDWFRTQIWRKWRHVNSWREKRETLWR